MESNKRISELLVETGAYTDLDEPVILASGELGIYYVNTEKLCQDGGEFKKYGNDSIAMIRHAVRMMKEHPTFEEVISILAERTVHLPINAGHITECTISGGQRRDWLFSGPVAYILALPHISLYKDGKVEFVEINKDGEPSAMSFNPADISEKIPGIIESLDNPGIKGLYAIHIVDLITEASSCYRVEDGEEKGWIPMLRKKEAVIDNLVAVVTRLQGGEEMLVGLEKPVTVHPFVAIDEDFLKQRSKNPERALAYMEDPKLWSESYIREQGVEALVGTFNPKGGKLDRAKKFLKRYEDVLKESGQLTSLGIDVENKYGLKLLDLEGEKK